jgi:lipopolysaccharide/colanic/teichoic acid biosynthesis glycosyltransferase
MNYETMKRLFDVLVSFLALIILMPIFLITAILVVITSGFPVFFRQDRLGKNEKVFRIYKFRSMTNNLNLDTSQKICEGDPEVTLVGRFIRRTKVDELPQLWNVLRGDLSIVGPRPALPSHLKGYTPRQRRRLEVKGGLTCLAQICGSRHLSWDERIEYDLKYIKRQSMWLDIKIILRTFLIITFGEQKYIKHPKIREHRPTKVFGEPFQARIE